MRVKPTTSRFPVASIHGLTPTKIAKTAIKGTVPFSAVSAIACVVTSPIRNGPRFGRFQRLDDTKGHFDRSDPDAVPILEPRGRFDAAIAHERAVLAAKILQRRITARDFQARVTPRHTRRVEE
jgi:hypothetical protein